MKTKITQPHKDPLGAMLTDYLSGDTGACVRVESENLDMWQMTGRTMFRSFKQMSRLERRALNLCRGKILDVGAGSGCHSLYLQKKHETVHAIDISPGCVAVMKKRKVSSPGHRNLFEIEDIRYDTILMLMNGMGICGCLDGLNLFFQFIRPILEKGGQVLADSTDLASLYPKAALLSQTDAYYGETRFIMQYKNIIGEAFDWLYIDFKTLKHYAALHGFSCTQLVMEKDFKYLVRLAPEP